MLPRPKLQPCIDIKMVFINQPNAPKWSAKKSSANSEQAPVSPIVRLLDQLRQSKSLIESDPDLNEEIAEALFSELSRLQIIIEDIRQFRLNPLDGSSQENMRRARQLCDEIQSVFKSGT